MRALVLLVASVTACAKPATEGGEDKPEAPIQVTCEAATATSITETVSVRGVVAAPPDRQATVAAVVPGRVAELLVHEGQVVAKGDVLAVIDDPALLAGQGEAEAQVATAKASAAAATTAATRAHRLLDEGIAARKDVEEADNHAAAATAELQAAVAKRVLAGAQRDRSRVKSPIAGTVVHLLRRAGELVDGTAQSAIAEVADPAHLELRADAPAGDAVRVIPGLLATVRLDAIPEVALPGRVVAVSPGVDPATSLGWLRVALDLPGDLGVHPRLGLAGQADILVGARGGVVAVPASAVRRGPEGHAEVLVCATDKDASVAHVQEITISGRTATAILVGDGLAAGTKVITDHVLNLEDGARITAGPEAK